MAPVKASVAAPKPDYARPVLLEGEDGGPPIEGPCVIQWRERKFTHDGRHYEHVAEQGDYWVYREMP